MPKYLYDVSGSIEVEAATPAEAHDQARKIFKRIVNMAQKRFADRVELLMESRPEGT